MTNFSVATNEYRGGEERTEYHSIVTWERLADICGQFLGKSPGKSIGAGSAVTLVTGEVRPIWVR